MTTPKPVAVSEPVEGDAVWPYSDWSVGCP